MNKNVQPVALQKVDDKTLSIKWADCHISIYDVRKLRLNCSCAQCVNEWSGERMVTDAMIQEDIKPKEMEAVGNYALKITWSDGHSAGLYTYKSLREELEKLAKSDSYE